MFYTLVWAQSRQEVMERIGSIISLIPQKTVLDIPSSEQEKSISNLVEIYLLKSRELWKQLISLSDFYQQF